jgi:hypothetical protein
MKIYNTVSRILMLALLSLTIFSCIEKEEESDLIGKVSFSTNDLIEVEGATLPLNINLGVDTYRHSGGKVRIEVSGGVYGVDYTLSTGDDSFELDVVKGTQLASFSVTPLNDAVVENNVNLVFTITNVSGGLQQGTDNEFKLTLLNDDNPTIGTVSFTSTAYQFDEQDTANKIIDFTFNQPTTTGGTITIAATGNAVYGSDYTIQNQTSGNFTITVAPLANSAQFVFNSVDDIVADNTKNVTFTITGVTGGLQFQSPNATTVSLIDNDNVLIPINYSETFEANTGTNYLTTVLGYQVLTNNQSPNLTTLMSANTAAGLYSNFNNVAMTSDNGINLFHNASTPANPALLGDVDQVLISPNFSANGNVTFSVDYNFGFPQNNGTVTFYWSETYSSGPFNPAQWTVLGTDNPASMTAAGTVANIYKRRTFSLNPTNNFKFAIRVNQNINATNYRTRWRFDNFKLIN